MSEEIIVFDADITRHKHKRKNIYIKNVRSKEKANYEAKKQALKDFNSQIEKPTPDKEFKWKHFCESDLIYKMRLDLKDRGYILPDIFDTYMKLKEYYSQVYKINQ